MLRGEHKAGISLPIGSTILTHLACLILIVPVGMAHHLPFFGVFRFGIAGFAVFERGWLFSASNEELLKRIEEVVAAHPHQALLESNRRRLRSLASASGQTQGYPPHPQAGSRDDTESAR